MPAAAPRPRTVRRSEATSRAAAGCLGGSGTSRSRRSGSPADTAELCLKVAQERRGTLTLTGAAVIRALFPEQVQQGGGSGFLYTRSGPGDGELLQAHPAKVYAHPKLICLTGVAPLVRSLGLQSGDRLRVDLLPDGKAVVEPAQPAEPEDPSRLPVRPKQWETKQRPLEVPLPTAIHLLGEKVARSPPGTWTFPVHEEGPSGQSLGPRVGELRSRKDKNTVRWYISGIGWWLATRRPPEGSFLHLEVVRGQGGPRDTAASSVTAITMRLLLPGSKFGAPRAE